MALLSEEMAEKLIALYKNKKDRKNKNYRLSKDTFKNMAGIERLSRTYLSRVDSELRKKELMLLDIIKEYEQIGIVSISSIMHLEKIIEDLEAEDEVEGPPQSRIGKNSSKPARGRRFSLPPGVHLQDKMRGNPDTGIRVGSGTGLVNVGLQLTSEAKDKTVIFPAGLLLVPKDNNTQNGLLVQEVVIIIPAHSEQKWILQSYCANSNLSEAYKSDEFEFCLVLRESKYLEFFELLKGKTISDEAALTVQDAVWELTNRGFLERETLDRIREI